MLDLVELTLTNVTPMAVRFFTAPPFCFPSPYRSPTYPRPCTPNSTATPAEW